MFERLARSGKYVSGQRNPPRETNSRRPRGESPHRRSSPAAEKDSPPPGMIAVITSLMMASLIATFKAAVSNGDSILLSASLRSCSNSAFRA